MSYCTATLRNILSLGQECGANGFFGVLGGNQPGHRVARKFHQARMISTPSVVAHLRRQRLERAASLIVIVFDDRLSQCLGDITEPL